MAMPQKGAKVTTKYPENGNRRQNGSGRRFPICVVVAQQARGRVPAVISSTATFQRKSRVQSAPCWTAHTCNSGACRVQRGSLSRGTKNPWISVSVLRGTPGANRRVQRDIRPGATSPLAVHADTPPVVALPSAPRRTRPPRSPPPRSTVHRVVNDTVHTPRVYASLGSARLLPFQVFEYRYVNTFASIEYLFKYFYS